MLCRIGVVTAADVLQIHCPFHHGIVVVFHRHAAHLQAAVGPGNHMLGAIGVQNGVGFCPRVHVGNRPDDDCPPYVNEKGGRLVAVSRFCCTHWLFCAISSGETVITACALTAIIPPEAFPPSESRHSLSDHVSLVSFGLIIACCFCLDYRQPGPLAAARFPAARALKIDVKDLHHSAQLRLVCFLALIRLSRWRRSRTPRKEAPSPHQSAF